MQIQTPQLRCRIQTSNFGGKSLKIAQHAQQHWSHGGEQSAQQGATGLRIGRDMTERWQRGKAVNIAKTCTAFGGLNAQVIRRHAHV